MEGERREGGRERGGREGERREGGRERGREGEREGEEGGREEGGREEGGREGGREEGGREGERREGGRERGGREGGRGGRERGRDRNRMLGTASFPFITCNTVPGEGVMSNGAHNITQCEEKPSGLKETITTLSRVTIQDVLGMRYCNGGGGTTMAPHVKQYIC